MMTPPTHEAQKIGKANAEMAFDQAGDFASLQDSIDSYSANVQDSLVDAGLLTEENFAAAYKMFDLTVAALREVARAN